MPRFAARCASRLAQGAVEPVLPLQPNEAWESQAPSQLRGDSCSGPCGRRVPRGEDSGADRVEQASSLLKNHSASGTHALPPTQPGISSVFLLGQFARAPESFFAYLELAAV